MPTIIVLSLVELFLMKYVDFSGKGFLLVAIGVVISLIIPFFTKLFKKQLYTKSERIVDNRTQKQIAYSNQSLKDALNEHIKLD